MAMRDDTYISPLVIDIETMPLSNAADFLEPVQAAKNLKDPEKIKADIESRTADRTDRLALDWNVGRICAIGWWTADEGVRVDMCPDEGAEAKSLREVWLVSRHRSIIGFNVKGFDLRYLIQRSRLLGVPHHDIDIGKYSRRGVVDLFLELTFFDGVHDQGCMRRSLKAFCRRFGIPVTDDIDGKDVPALALAGEWDKIEAHVRADLMLTVALARRLGVVAQAREEVA